MTHIPRSKSSRQANRRRPSVIGLEDRLLPSASGVTDVLSYHNNAMLSGQDLTETTLTPSNVNPTDFGMLYSQPVDGYVYAQPLVKTGVMIGGVAHDVVIVATENDTVYAFDADSNLGADAKPLWSTSFIDPTKQVSTVPSIDTFSSDIVPHVGITGTPVIDGSSGTLYVVAATKQFRDGVDHYIQTLFALDLSTGAEKVPGGYVIGDTIEYFDGTNANATALAVPGTGVDSVNGIVTFNALTENQRPGLVLAGNTVLVSWASHGDRGPFHGWLAAFDTTTLQPVSWFNTSPNGTQSGIWQGGEPPAVDPITGAIYFATGNGSVDAPGTTPRADYGESVVRLNPTPTGDQFTVGDYFTPYEYQLLNDQDADFGSGGTMLLPDSVGSAAHPHLLVAAGKEGKIYLVDRDQMGELSNPGKGPDDVVQTINTNNPGIWGSPSYLQVNSTTGIIYYHSVNNDLLGYYITNGRIEDGSGQILRGNINSGYPGAQPVISANGTADPNNPINPIVWEVDVKAYGYGGPAILRAYNATDPAGGTNLPVIYDSSMAGYRDQAGVAVKFTVPTVANGHVYVAADGNISVYGEFPTSTTAPASPTNFSASITTSGTSLQFSWTNPTPAAGAVASENVLLQSNDGGYSYFGIVGLPGSATQYISSGSYNLGQTFNFKLEAVNQSGTSAPSNVTSATIELNPSTLAPLNVASSAVSLSWTPQGNDHYEVQRSTDGIAYENVAYLPISQRSYVDTGLTPGTYSYRIESFIANSPATSLSNVEGGTVGASIADGMGFNNTTNLTANGSALFSETDLRITNSDQQTGSVFADNRFAVASFNTSFTIRDHEGTQPNYSDGIAFVIQADSPTALGQGLGGLGYEGIDHSVAIKLDTFRNQGDPSASSTGLFVNGAAPIGGVDTSNGGPGLLIDSQDPKLVTLSYDGTTLTETITDTLNSSDSFTTSYAVDILKLIGSDTAYVGFTGSTGDDDLWQLQDITNWNFTSTAPVPGAPSSLREVVENPSEVDLAWASNSYNEMGYRVERSQDGVDFVVVGTTTTTSFRDTGLASGNYEYRVSAYNLSGQSPDSTTLVAHAGVLVDHSGGFANNGDLAFNGRSAVTGSTANVITGSFGVAGSVFTKSRVPINQFTTTFLFEMLPSAGIPIDNGLTFTIENDPRGSQALGGIANALGYGSTIYGGQPIADSVSIKFDAADNGQSSTGIYFDGDLGGQALGPDRDVSLGSSGIDFNAGAFANVPNQYQATLNYDGTTLSETIVDITDGASFTTSYRVNIASYLGSATGYVGFTAGDLFQTSYQEVVTWSGQFSGADPATQLVVAGGSNPQPNTPTMLTVTAEDAFNNVVPTYTGKVHFTSSDPRAVLPADYTFLPSDGGVHIFPVTFRTGGSQVVVATDASNPGLAYAASFQVIYPILVKVNSIAAVTPNPRGAPVSSVAVTFSEPIDISSLSPGALVLTDDGGANLINGAVSLALVSGDTYAINGLTGLTTADGLYTLSINAADLLDLGGLNGTGSLSTSWLMDSTTPTSLVSNTLARSQSSDSFPVTVAYSDPADSLNAPGSDVSSLDLYVSVNNGPFTLYQTLTFAPTASGVATFTFAGQDRNVYAFHSLAHDAAGNTQNKASNAIDASTSVPDLNPPVTHVLAASSYANGTFAIAWAGTDPDQSTGTPTGSIALVAIYVVVDANAPLLIGQPSAGSPNGNGVYSASLSYNALADGVAHTYSFYSVGVDDQQKRQAAPASPDVTFAGVTYIAPLAVQQLSVEDGIAGRSFIQYLDVNFNLNTSTSPALQSLATGLSGGSRNAFVELVWYGEGLTASSIPKGSVNLFNTGTTASVALSGNDLSINFGANGITSLLTETNVSGTGGPTKTFGDGWYALGVDPTGNSSNGQVFWLPFFRLLGDTDGNGVVNGPYTTAGTDAANVYNNEGKSGTLLSADVDGSGVINSKDLTETNTSKGNAVGTVAPASFPQFQLFAGGPAQANAVAVTQAQVQALLPLAIDGWIAAGLEAADVRKLQRVTVRVGDLGAGILGLEAANTILINQTAAGFDWSLDAGAGPDAATSGSLSAGRVDLLTVLEHELGHVIGLPDNASAGDLMDVTLGLGIRRTPSAADVAAVDRIMGTIVSSSSIASASDGLPSPVPISQAMPIDRQGDDETATPTGATAPGIDRGPGQSTPRNATISQATVDAALESMLDPGGDNGDNRLPIVQDVVATQPSSGVSAIGVTKTGKGRVPQSPVPDPLPLFASRSNLKGFRPAQMTSFGREVTAKDQAL